MKKTVLIAPDSFKGSMSAKEVAEIIAGDVKKYTDFEPICIPIADGGEGSIDCLLSAIKGKRYEVDVKSPEWKDTKACYAICEDGKAIVEFAQSSGITKQDSFQATKATSYGFGQVIKAALDQGARDFILCLGGSATTDGACGMAAALGVVFLNEKKESFVPDGGTLSDICQISFEQMDERIKESTFLVMCDVENTVCGPNGAAYVYGPQKGAKAEELPMLDSGLHHLAKLLEETMDRDFLVIKGGGAAGGAGMGCVAFLNAKLQSGIDVILDLYQFDSLLDNCEMVVTGEGKLDEQSLMGKVLSGIKRRSGQKPIIAFCGICELPASKLLQNGIQAVEIGRGIALSEAMKNGRKYLQEKSNEVWKGIF